VLAACRTGLRCVSAHLRRRCSQWRCARCSSWLDRRPTAATTVATRDCLVAAMCIAAHPRRPPDPPTRRRSPLLRPGVAASNCSSAVDQPRDVQLRRRTEASPDRVASAALDRPAARPTADGAMSSPGPAAKLALKRQTGLMGGDIGLAATTAAAQAQRSAAAAQPAAAAAVAAAATGACDLQAFASQSLPVVPARSSTTGRPVAPHPFFVAGRDHGRGRGRGSPQEWCSQQRWRRRR
jgi:hypothetical protein